MSLEEVSSEVGFSGSYFSTLFRKETEKNFLEYLTDVRIDEAKVLLRESRMTIENVAKSVGINDYKRFSKTLSGSLIRKRPESWDISRQREAAKIWSR
ncbi:helix-turn-helix domain-containing protein [Laedolimicola sp.]|uniref:helix-turn-helix domain-containing protein n=1 Tax=Laedolimicola sp. TaxID=2981663 RepID=UPI003F81045F